MHVSNKRVCRGHKHRQNMEMLNQPVRTSSKERWDARGCSWLLQASTTTCTCTPAAVAAAVTLVHAGWVLSWRLSESWSSRSPDGVEPYNGPPLPWLPSPGGPCRSSCSGTENGLGRVPAEQVCNGVSPLLSPHRYFTNISIGGRDYSFNSDGYLSNPLLDVISYINGRGWEEVSARRCVLMLMAGARQP